MKRYLLRIEIPVTAKDDPEARLAARDALILAFGAGVVDGEALSELVTLREVREREAPRPVSFAMRQNGWFTGRQDR